MRIVMTRDVRIGNRRVAEGEEIDLPDRLATAFLNAGHASEPGSKAKPKAKAKAEPEPESEDKKKTYKTRHIKAEE